MNKNLRAVTLCLVPLGLLCPGLAALSTAQSIEERIDAKLTELAAGHFAGVVLVARGEEVLLTKGYGLAHREEAIPFAPDTVSTIGSITKQFTGAAILKLAEAGKLDPADPAADPRAPLRPVVSLGGWRSERPQTRLGRYSVCRVDRGGT